MSCIPMLQAQESASIEDLQLLRRRCFDELMACASRTRTDVWLAQIIASWLTGMGELPDFLGLTQAQFNDLLQRHFSGYCLSGKALSGKTADYSRMLEKQDLEQLLARYAKDDQATTACLIGILVAACLGNNHLWQDLGLWSRQDLSHMLLEHFPELSQRNGKDMKWKKFLYKQLCEEEGLYVCRAPSCEVCMDYRHCFGAED